MSVIKPISQFDFYPTLDQSEGLNLVYFTAAACSSCRYLSSVLTQLAAERPELRIFNVDAQQESALVNEYEVFHLPSMFLFKNSEYHAEIHAPANGDAIFNAIQAAAEKPAQEAP